MVKDENEKNILREGTQTDMRPMCGYKSTRLAIVGRHSGSGVGGIK